MNTYCSRKDLFIIISLFIFINWTWSKVYDFQRTICGWALEHNILRFQISVNNLLRMAMGNSIKYFYHPTSSHSLCDAILSFDLLKEFSAFTILHDNINPRIINKDLVNTNYILMVLNDNKFTKFLSIFI